MEYFLDKFPGEVQSHKIVVVRCGLLNMPIACIVLYCLMGPNSFVLRLINILLLVQT